MDRLDSTGRRHPLSCPALPPRSHPDQRDGSAVKTDPSPPLRSVILNRVKDPQLHFYGCGRNPRPCPAAVKIDFVTPSALLGSNPVSQCFPYISITSLRSPM